MNVVLSVGPYPLIFVRPSRQQKSKKKRVYHGPRRDHYSRKVASPLPDLTVAGVVAKRCANRQPENRLSHETNRSEKESRLSDMRRRYLLSMRGALITMRWESASPTTITEPDWARSTALPGSA